MRGIWFISDTHFQHKNIIRFNGEDFNSVEERDEMLVDNWNSVVKEGDYVYHLGDVMFGSKETFKTLWPRLKGSKRLVVGNHDDIKYMASGGFFKKITMWRQWDDKDLLFTHVPVHPSALNERMANPDRAINVHGHTHRHGSPDGPYRSVCVEMIGYKPIHLEDLIV